MTFPKQRLPLLLATTWLIMSQMYCPDRYPYFEDSLKPVYADSVKIHQVLVEAPRSLKNTAKIYYKDSTIYIIEKDSGIHVINNRNPVTPQPIRFIKLQGCEDIAIKGQILYASNFTDLVTIDITKPNEPKMVGRLSGIYPSTVDGKPALNYRRNYGNYQCVDSTKGKVIAWEYGKLDSTKCFKPF
jgi:hypothetical protein